MPFDDATELLSQLEAGSVTSSDLLEQHVEQLRAHNQALNVVVATHLDEARHRAQQADEARARGESWGPLHGLPMTIKDSYEVVGMPTSSGSSQLKSHIPKTNADAVQRLVDAGAIVYGKTNLPRFAGEWQSFNKVYGTTNNPWDPARTPGGSSGGSAASLASGFTPLELGSDIGGSIRIPAHFCGVCGHKPTYGTISMRGHVPGPPGTIMEGDLAVAGPMARSVRDLDLALGVLAGARPEDQAWALNLPAPATRTLGDYRVAVWMEDPFCPIENDVRQALQKALDGLRREGMTIERGACSSLSLEKYVDPYIRLLGAVMGSGVPAKMYRMLQLAGPALKLQWRLQKRAPYLATYVEGVTQTHREWLRTNEKRGRMIRRIHQWFDDVDILLTPVAPWAAFPHTQDKDVLNRRIPVPSGKRDYVEHLPWVALATVLGLPATTIPVGRTSAGLPVGLQIVGPRFGDRTCLAFAAEVERVLGGFSAPPALA